MIHPRQPNLFNSAISPLHTIVFSVRLRLQKIRTKKNFGHSSWLIKESDRLVQLTEALISGDPALLRQANVTSEQARIVAERLTVAAGAMARRQN